MTDQVLRWDYTHLAASYDERAPYAEALEALLRKTSGVQPGDRACDIGAGTGALTQRLCAMELQVTAVEPNAAMRARGQHNCRAPSLRWTASTAEDTGLPSDQFDLVTFGSSFNVTDRALALVESARILHPGAWLMLVFNHRQLDDPLQASIEELIKTTLPDYQYGSRREDQRALIEGSGLFAQVSNHRLETVHEVSKPRFLRGWSAHATLRRQAGNGFEPLLARIGQRIDEEPGERVSVPFHTTVTFAQRVS